MDLSDFMGDEGLTTSKVLILTKIPEWRKD